MRRLRDPFSVYSTAKGNFERRMPEAFAAEAPQEANA